MDPFVGEIVEETRRNNDDDIEAVAAGENAAPSADLPFHAAAAANGDDDDEEEGNQDAEEEEAAAAMFDPAEIDHEDRDADPDSDEDDGNHDDADEDADEDEDEEDEEEDLFGPAEIEQIFQEAASLLQNRLNLPSRIRDRTMVRFAQQFINNVKEDIHKMVTDTRIEDEGYDGLDSARDTEEEVETAIRCGPEVLAREDDRLGLHPIQCLTMMEGDNGKSVCNVRAVAFVPLFAQLAIEFHSFNETERGGLLAESPNGPNILEDLVHSSDHIDDHHNQHADTTFLAVLIRLRQVGLLTIGDIQHYELVHHWCCHGWHRALGRFRFLTEWCPSSLITSSNSANGRLALHWTTLPLRLTVRLDGNIEVFRLYLDALFRFYPKWRGITALFQKDAFGTTSFEMACTTYTRTRVLDVVEAILVRYTTTTPPVNISDALMMAAIDTNINLDGVYFLMRRQPATMLSMLRRDSTTDTSNTNDTNDGITVNNNHSNSNNSNNAIILRRSTRKRKRA